MIKGIFYSLLASVLFNCIYYMSVLMNPISTQALIGYRMIFAMPFVIAAIFLLKQQRNFKFLLLKIKLKPKILLVLLATSLIVSFQMWLYLWAPSNGSALKVSILGVFSTAVISGGISWESAVVFCLYPVYFTIRKYYNLANFSSFVIEIIFMFLFSFYFALTADMDYVMSQNPNIYYLLILLGAISGIALIAQILSSTLVPINVLGLLTYFEPIMMLFVSFAIGERLEKSSYFLMICLAISVTLLMIDSINSIKGDKNTKTK